MKRSAALSVPVFLCSLAACSSPPPAGETPVSQAGVDGYQDKRLDELEARVDKLERELRGNPPASAAPADFAARAAPGVSLPSPAPAPAPKGAVEILELSYRPTETNPSWTRYSWRAVVRNNTASPLPVTVIVQFQDGDNFVLDEDSERVLLGPGELRAITDFKLVEADIAPRVARGIGRIER